MLNNNNTTTTFANLKQNNFKTMVVAQLRVTLLDYLNGYFALLNESHFKAAECQTALRQIEFHLIMFKLDIL